MGEKISLRKDKDEIEHIRNIFPYSLNRLIPEAAIDFSFNCHIYLSQNFSVVYPLLSYCDDPFPNFPFGSSAPEKRNITHGRLYGTKYSQ